MVSIELIFDFDDNDDLNVDDNDDLNVADDDDDNVDLNVVLRIAQSILLSQTQGLTHSEKQFSSGLMNKRLFFFFFHKSNKIIIIIIIIE